MTDHVGGMATLCREVLSECRRQRQKVSFNSQMRNDKFPSHPAFQSTNQPKWNKINTLLAFSRKKVRVCVTLQRRKKLLLPLRSSTTPTSIFEKGLKNVTF